MIHRYELLNNIIEHYGKIMETRLLGAKREHEERRHKT